MGIVKERFNYLSQIIGISTPKILQVKKECYCILGRCVRTDVAAIYKDNGPVLIKW
jgi:hypothetical protein